jgi:hypothetical protein
MWSLWPNIRFLPSIVVEKNVTNNILEGRTDRGKTVYSPPPSGSGGIIRSKIGSKCVDLILIRLAKCWNNFFSSKFCIWFFINLPLKLFNFNFMFFFQKKYFYSESWRKKFGWIGKKIYSDLTFSQYNHIQLNLCKLFHL